MASWLNKTSASVALAALTVSGCYASTADEDLLPEFESRADAGAPVPDAAPAPVADASVPKCSSADPIALFLCQLTASPQQPQQAAVPDLTSILGSLGGLANIAQVLGPVLGTTDPRAPTNAQAGGLVDLVNLAGGLGNIAQLLNQLLGGQAPLGSLFNGGAQTMQPASLSDFFTGLGIPVAGPDTTLSQEPSEDDCANPATPAQQFACALQAAQ